MDKDWLQKLFINEAKPALNRHSGGSGSAGGMELNIAYGDTPPEDTSKLWVKCEEPSGVRLLPDMHVGEISTLNATLPTAAYAMYAATIGTNIYLFGGQFSNGLSSSIYKFNIETSKTSKLSTPLPDSGAYDIAYALVDTNVYIIGGYKSSYRSTIHVFDAKTSTMSTHSATLPTTMSAMGSATVGNNIYLFGGNRNSTGQDTIHVFDTEASTVSTLSTKLPTGVMKPATAAVGTKVYLFSGNTTNNECVSWMFDTETSTLSTLSVVLDSEEVVNCASAVVGTNIYLFGGSRSGMTSLDTIHVFDTNDSTLLKMNSTLPTVTTNIASAAVGNKIYLFGGYSNGASNDIRTFIPFMTLEQNNVGIVVDATANMIELIPRMTLGVSSVHEGNSKGIAEPVEAYLYKDGAWTLI